MRRNWRCVAWTAGIIIGVLVIAAAIVFAYFDSGRYDVSALYPDRPVVASFLDTTMTRSVQRHAVGIRVPPLDSPALFRLGFQHYRGMCVECHAGPGVEAEELAKGLSPSPPKLVESAGDWKPNELRWLVKNGVRMTGLPAWGRTHSGEEWKTPDQELPPLAEE